MANGKRFNPARHTVASRTYPLGTCLKITDKKTRRSVFAKVTDRGPWSGHRILDLSPRVAHLLGLKELGTVRVHSVQTRFCKGD
jgi:rare lipoprotein A